MLLSLLRFSSGDRVTVASSSDVQDLLEAFYIHGRRCAHGRGQRRILSTSARREGWETPEEAPRKAVEGIDLALERLLSFLTSFWSIFKALNCHLK